MRKKIRFYTREALGVVMLILILFAVGYMVYNNLSKCNCEHQIKSEYKTEKVEKTIKNLYLVETNKAVYLMYCDDSCKVVANDPVLISEAIESHKRHLRKKKVLRWIGSFGLFPIH